MCSAYGIGPLSVALFVLLLQACSQGSAPPETLSQDTVASDSTCALSVGYDPYEPYQYTDADGKVKGLDVELVLAASAMVNCTPHFVEGEWASLVRDLKAGHIDLLAGATRNNEREKFARFSKAVRDESFVLYVRAGELERWSARTLEDALARRKMRVGITEGYLYGEPVNGLLMNDHYSAQFLKAATGLENFRQLRASNVDGVLEDPFVAASLIQREQWNTDIARQGLSLPVGQVHFMFSSASISADTVVKFDKALELLKSNGRYQQILDRYLKSDADVK